MKHRHLPVLVCGMLLLALMLVACSTASPGEAETTGTPATPTEAPTTPATETSTEAPTEAPTVAPTEEPTEAPTVAPTEEPTEAPTEPETEPAGYVPVVRFVVASDPHIVDTANVEAQRLSQMFRSAYRYALGHDAYTKIDAFVLAGDVTDHGRPDEYTALMTLLNRATKNRDTQVVLTMGNHDWYEGTAERFVDMTGQPLCQDVVINGFHLLAMSSIPGELYDDETLAWLSDSVKAAAAEDPEKPIFTFQHHPLKDTVYLSDAWTTGSSDTLMALFRQYPQVVSFAGHTHGPINLPQAIWQDGFTALGTGTLTYFEMAPGMTDGAFPPGFQDAAQFYIVEVDAGNHVRIMPYDLITDKFFPTPANTDAHAEQLVYEIDRPSDPTTFRYTNRAETATPPRFASHISLRVADVTTYSVTLTVPTAQDDQCLYSYDFVCTSPDGATVEYHAFYEFYRAQGPGKMSYTIKGLKGMTAYTVEVYPVNCYGQRGEPLTVTFTTK